jgi:hypothetical protein
MAEQYEGNSAACSCRNSTGRAEQRCRPPRPHGAAWRATGAARRRNAASSGFQTARTVLPVKGSGLGASRMLVPATSFARMASSKFHAGGFRASSRPPEPRSSSGRPPCSGDRPRVQMRVQACLRRARFDSACCNRDSSNLQHFSSSRGRCSSTAWTLNPKVAGSNPARAHRFAGILSPKRSAVRTCVRTRTRPRGDVPRRFPPAARHVLQFVSARLSLFKGILRPIARPRTMTASRSSRDPKRGRRPLPPRTSAPT